MKRPIKTARKIVVNGIEYYWLVSMWKFIFWYEVDGKNKKEVHELHDFLGMTHEELNDEYYEDNPPSIMPKDVATWIKKNK